MPLLTEFSPREIADIHFYYGMCRGVARAARIAYIAAFPNRMQPSAQNFQEVHRRFSNVGLGLAREHRQQADVIDTSIEEAVLNDVFADPTTSTRRLAARHVTGVEFGFSKMPKFRDSRDQVPESPARVEKKGNRKYLSILPDPASTRPNTLWSAAGCHCREV
ncbi:hypothetical protein ACJJTC_015249 [Scirpophaga incertulas]